MKQYIVVVERLSVGGRDFLQNEIISERDILEAMPRANIPFMVGEARTIKEFGDPIPLDNNDDDGEMSSELSAHTKERLLELASKTGVHVAKSWSKDKIINAITQEPDAAVESQEEDGMVTASDGTDYDFNTQG